MANYETPRRPLNSYLGAVIILTIFIAILIVISVRAIQVLRQAAVGAVLRVPGDYQTIQAAIDAAKPGDIVQISAGVYNENLTLNKAVTLVGETFDQVNPVNNLSILDGGSGAVTILIPTGLTQMPTIRGIVIRNGADGIQATSPFTAEYNFIHSSLNLVSYQTGGGGFNRGNIYFNAGDNAIRLDNMDHPLLIENNRILYSGDDGIEISLQNAAIPPAMIEVDIWNNMILGNREDGIQFIDHPGDPQDTNRRFVIAGNLIANSRKAGIGLMPNANTLEDYSGGDVAEAIRVFHNTFYGNDYGISGGDNLVAFNNIIVNSPNIAAWRVQGPAGANSVVAYTLFHNNRLDVDQSTLGVGDISGQDPLFVGAPNPGPDGAWETVDDDFSGLVLRSGSPAIDKGITQFFATNGELVPPHPITGYTGAAPDLGWREFGAPLFITPSPTPVNSLTPIPTLTPVTPTITLTLTPTIPASATPLTPTATPSPTVPATNTAAPASPTAAPPTITSTATLTPIAIQGVTPNAAQADTAVVLTINGSGFQSGATVAFEGGAGLPQEIVSTEVVNSNTIIVTFNARNDGSAGAQVWDIRVTNPDTTTAVLADAFTVLPPP
ncbi:MAG TPA: right-handed parallel beta-helix repeat-containing protein [Anaerolineales bacterium]|nr:right-handed parallel beta-helix repeat-containing protein [Anaerolineales bacterium]